MSPSPLEHTLWKHSHTHTDSIQLKTTNEQKANKLCSGPKLHSRVQPRFEWCFSGLSWSLGMCPNNQSIPTSKLPFLNALLLYYLSCSFDSNQLTEVSIGIKHHACNTEYNLLKMGWHYGLVEKEELGSNPEGWGHGSQAVLPLSKALNLNCLCKHPAA